MGSVINIILWDQRKKKILLPYLGEVYFLKSIIIALSSLFSPFLTLSSNLIKLVDRTNLVTERKGKTSRFVFIIYEVFVFKEGTAG